MTSEATSSLSAPAGNTPQGSASGANSAVNTIQHANGLNLFLDSVSRSLETTLEGQMELFSQAIALHPELGPSSCVRHTVDDATRTFITSVKRFRADVREAALALKTSGVQQLKADTPPEIADDCREEVIKEVIRSKVAEASPHSSDSRLSRSKSCLDSEPSDAPWDHFDSPTFQAMREGMIAHGAPILLRLRAYTGWLVTRHEFESLFALLITLNVMVMAAESQYEGSVLDMYNGESNNPAWISDDRVVDWPAGYTGTMSVFEVIEWVFGIVFLVEIAIKLFGLGATFFLDWWNYVDVAVVASWIVTVPLKSVVGSSLDFNATIFRLGRLGRLFRLVKLMRAMSGMDALVLMFTAIQASKATLFWAIVLLLTMQVFGALILNQLLFPYFQDPHKPLYQREEVYLYFGTFSRSLLSMFELTLANWPPICRCVQENVSQWYTILFVLHKLVVGFAVVGVINGVFMQETFKVAALDDMVMVRQKERQKAIHESKMRRFFAAADDNHSGALTVEEFEGFIDHPEVETWLAAQDLVVSDQDALWALIDSDGDGSVSVEELISGVAKHKGAARSIDLALLMKEFAAMRQDLRVYQVSGTRAAAKGPKTILTHQL